MSLILPQANHPSVISQHRMDRLRHFLHNTLYHNRVLSPTFQFHVLWPLFCFLGGYLDTRAIPQLLLTLYNSDIELSVAAGGSGDGHIYHQYNIQSSNNHHLFAFYAVVIKYILQSVVAAIPNRPVQRKTSQNSYTLLLFFNWAFFCLIRASTVSKS